MPRFAANLSMMFNEWPFLDRFAAAADAGFSAVEYLFPYEHPAEEIARRLAARGLTLALFNAPPGDWAAGERGLAALPGRQDDFRRSIQTALTYAAATGGTRFHVMSGCAEAGNPAAWQTYRDNIAYAAGQAATAGLEITIEPINNRDMPGYFLNHFDLATGLIAELGSGSLRLQFDIYHRQILHGDVTLALRRLMPMIGHIQIAGVPDRNEPTRGELNDPLLFQEIDRLGYAGFIGCEYRPKDGTLAGLDWLSAVSV